MLAGADALAVVGAALAAGTVDGELAGFVVLMAPAWIVLAKVNGLYDRDHVKIRHETFDELPQIFHWVTLASAATGLLLATSFGPGAPPRAALLVWAVSFVLAVVGRASARAIWRRLVDPEAALVLGSGVLADALVRKLQLERGHHVTLARRVELDEDSTDIARGAALDEVEACVESGEYERVVLAIEDLDADTLARVVLVCRANGVKFSVAPPLRAMLGTAVELDHLAELPLIEFRTWDPSRSTMLLKRIIDLVLAGGALIVFSPLMLATAVAVRVDSRGPAIFRQRRAGQGGRPFEMLKFRTMVEGAEQKLSDLVAVDDLDEPVFKLRDDPRVTRVGRFLRRYSIDELPQLINVLRGEMSLVGPRPEEVWLTERYSDNEVFRLAMRPGMTGPMQVHGRGDLTFQERLAVEREYIENYSLRKDMQILLRTPPIAVGGAGAY
jgi:exopolysaccharide biosynthesis polyprenyl glycosylphosphotransferase